MLSHFLFCITSGRFPPGYYIQSIGGFVVSVSNIRESRYLEDGDNRGLKRACTGMHNFRNHQITFELLA